MKEIKIETETLNYIELKHKVKMLKKIAPKTATGNPNLSAIIRIATTDLLAKKAK